MREVIEILAIVAGIIIGGYIIGRLFAKGLLKEIDLFLNKKYIDRINNKKEKENDNKTQE